MSEKVWTAKDVEYILQIAQDVLSLDTPISAGEDGKDFSYLGDFIEDPTPTPLEQLIKKDERDIVNKYVNMLSEREATVIKMRFGFDDGIPMSLEECGKVLGITRERVRQIEAKALRKLRAKFVRNNVRKELMDD